MSDLFIDTEDSEDGQYVIAPDGRKVFQQKIILTDKGFEMLRAGYLCGHCFQDLKKIGCEAFPKNCPVCGFAIRELQSAQIERDFRGQVQLGSKLSLLDELERLRMGDFRNHPF